MGAPDRLDSGWRGAARQFLAAAAQDPAVVHRQYRLPSCAPPDAAGPELPAASRAPGRTGVRRQRDRADALAGPARAQLHAVGRDAWGDGPVPAPPAVT